MEEENHFTQTLLPALFAALAAGLLPMAAPLSLFSLLSCSLCSLSVPIYRQDF